MRRLFLLLVLVLGFAVSAQAQLKATVVETKAPVAAFTSNRPVVPTGPIVPATGGHSVVLTWTAPADVSASSTYDIFKLSSASCPASGTTGFVKITAAPVAVLTFTDNAPNVGSQCYYAVQNQGGAASGPSNLVAAVILPLPPVLSVQSAN
jgi:hypothetical protein